MSFSTCLCGDANDVISVAGDGGGGGGIAGELQPLKYDELLVVVLPTSVTLLTSDSLNSLSLGKNLSNKTLT